MKKQCPVSYETLGIQADMKPRDYIKYLRERIEFLESCPKENDAVFITHIAQVSECKSMIKWIEANASGEQ